MSYQQIIIQGNCTRDAEVRQVGQSHVAKIGVAVSEKYKDRSGQTQESTEFFDVEIWDKPGVYQYLTKGASILVVGQIKTEKWTDQSGQNRESKKVRAQVVQLCGSRPLAQPSAPSSVPQAPGYAPAPAYQAPPQPQYQAPARPQQYAPPTSPASPQYAPAPTAAPAYAPQPMPGYNPAEDPDLPF